MSSESEIWGISHQGGKRFQNLKAPGVQVTPIASMGKAAMGVGNFKPEALEQIRPLNNLARTACASIDLSPQPANCYGNDTLRKGKK